MQVHFNRLCGFRSPKTISKTHKRSSYRSQSQIQISYTQTIRHKFQNHFITLSYFGNQLYFQRTYQSRAFWALDLNSDSMRSVGEQYAMDVYSQYSDPYPGSKMFSQSIDHPGTVSSSMSEVKIGRRRSYSDEEIMLASRHPKKRAGRKKFRETRHPVFRGVRKRNSNKWVCEVREPNKKNRIWLGTYPTAEMAARAHDVAALAFRGLKSCLNFADSAWCLPVPASTDAADIQKAAAEAAEMFRATEVTDDLKKGSMIRTINVVSSEDNNKEKNKQTEKGTSYMDEEAIFDMPGLLNNMAEGLLLPPPSYLDPELPWDNTNNHTDMTLWNHSF